MKSSDKSKGQQPEVLAGLAAATKNNGEQPGDHVLTATPQTKPIPTNPSQKADAATKVLREGVTGKNQGAKAAVEKLPDRTHMQPRK